VIGNDLPPEFIGEKVFQLVLNADMDAVLSLYGIHLYSPDVESIINIYTVIHNYGNPWFLLYSF